MNIKYLHGKIEYILAFSKYVHINATSVINVWN